MLSLTDRTINLIKGIEQLEIDQRASIQTKQKLEARAEEILAETRELSRELDIATNAITLLREVSDEAVHKSYEFIEDSINASLERIFRKTKRKIRLKEWTRAGKYPQLEIELIVEGGKVRTLKTDSGHGLMQIISLLCILSLIVITGSRRILVLDEVLSGLSANSRRIVSEILWSFTEIGFQFIISEHGFIPKGAKVYELKMEGGVSFIEKEYIEGEGIFINEVILQDMMGNTGDIEGELDGEVITEEDIEEEHIEEENTGEENGNKGKDGKIGKGNVIVI